MSKELNENQQLAIQLLASGSPCTAVSETVGVCKETISRWKKTPEFQAALNTLLEESRENTRTRLANMAGKALEVIESDLDAIDDPSRRTRAALKVLQLIGASTLALPNHSLPVEPEEVRLEQRKKIGMDF